MGLEITGAVLVSHSPDHNLGEIDGHEERLERFLCPFGLSAPANVGDYSIRARHCCSKPVACQGFLAASEDNKV